MNEINIFSIASIWSLFFLFSLRVPYEIESASISFGAPIPFWPEFSQWAMSLMSQFESVFQRVGALPRVGVRWGNCIDVCVQRWLDSGCRMDSNMAFSPAHISIFLVRWHCWVNFPLAKCSITVKLRIAMRRETWNISKSNGKTYSQPLNYRINKQH